MCEGQILIAVRDVRSESITSILACSGGCLLIPHLATVERTCRHVRFVPITGLMHRSKRRAYSMTSSARSRMDCGISRPIALAVFKLSTNSNFEACSTGMSDGLVPAKILAMMLATRRNIGI